MKKDRRELFRAIKFTLFSASAGIIQFVVTLLLASFVIKDDNLYWIPYLIGLVCSVVYNFTINRKFTFHSAANVPVAMLKVFAFYCVFTPLSTLWVRYFTESLHWNKLLVQAGTMLVNFVTEYLFTRFVVFRNQVDNDGTVPVDQQSME